MARYLELVAEGETSWSGSMGCSDESYEEIFRDLVSDYPGAVRKMLSSKRACRALGFDIWFHDNGDRLQLLLDVESSGMVKCIGEIAREGAIRCLQRLNEYLGPGRTIWKRLIPVADELEPEFRSASLYIYVKSGRLLANYEELVDDL